MEEISKLGRGIFEVIPPTFQIYGDLLRKSPVRQRNDQIQCEKFSYGTHPRQQLDLYIAPPNASLTPNIKQSPILIFIYGGGLVVGDKVLKDIPDELVYRNLGCFFAGELGFDTIVMDYRLLSHGASYPSGAVDIDTALQWVLDRYQGFGSREMYIMGNSAGGLHLATWLFAEDFETTRGFLLNPNSDGHVNLAGIVFLGCAHRLDPEGPMKDVLETYYGTKTRIVASEPMRLMLDSTSKAKPTAQSKMLRILSVVSEYDPEFIVDSTEEFHRLWIEQGGEGKFVILKGHNHISPPLSLGTDLAQEEEWGYMVGGWLLNGTL